MKFLSDILAKAGLTVDGVVTLNNTATGQTPASNDNSTKLATTAWVRTFVQPYSLPIASTSILGGIKVGTGLSIDAGSGILSVTGGGAASIKSTQTFTATAAQTVFTITGGYSVGLIDVFLNGVYLSPNQTTATNGTTVILGDAAAAGDIIDVIVASPVYEGATTTTDQLPEGSTNLYFTNARARSAVSLTTTGVSGVATYNSSTGVFNIPNYQGLVPSGGIAGDILAKVDGTDYNTTWIPNFTSTVQHTVKAGVALTKGQAVYVSSADGTNMIVSKASNASEQTSSKTLGLVAQNLATNGQGFVVTEGLLAGLNTSTANAGDPVWLGTDGNLIFGLLNKPYAPAHLVFIGVVTRVQSNNGEIFVKVQNGFELDELHDLSVKNASDGDMIKYVASTGLWTKIAASTTNIVEGTNLYYTQGRFDTAFTAKSTTNLTEGTNLYYTTARFDTRLATKSTTDLVEGTNLYYTTARANSDFDTRLATKSTTNLAEGTNLYYTDTRVGTYLTNNSYATQTYVNTAVSNLVDAAPGTLDTLNELAAALGDDPNFATTVATSIGTKEPTITAGTTSQYWRGDKSWQTLPVYTLSGLGGVPTTRTITINGTAQDLSADRTFTINSMVYPGAGIALSTGSAWGTSITDNSANWNTAFGWGNHASGGYLTTASAASTYVSLSGTYANPSWITSLAYSKITGVPAFITSYTEVDTLATVTARGASTSTNSIFSGGLQSRKNQTDNNYTTAALWTESFGNTTTGIAFHISGVVGKFLEMRTNGTLYWENGQVWTSSTLTNLNQLSNGPGYITSSGNISGSAGSLSDDSGYIRTRSGGTEANLDLYTDNGIRTVAFSGHSQHLLTWNVGGSTGTIQQLFHYNMPANGWRIRNKTDNSSWSSWGYVVMTTGNQGNISGTIYHSGNLTNLNQLTNGPGYITGESDTLATVTARGASTTAAITISREAAAYGGTTQSFLVDGAGGNGALTINAASAYAYLSFAQAGVSKWEIGAEGAATNKGSLYFNHNIQVGSTGAALYLKKSNGYVGINQIDPTYQLHINTSANEGIYLKGSGGGVWMNIQSGAGNLWSIGAQTDGMGVYNRTSNLYAFFIKDNRQLQIAGYTSSSSYSGTAAGYLAFDSSGNIITLASVAATDSSKLPLAGGTMSAGITFSAPGGTVLLKHAVAEVDAWIFQENAANWGLYYKNNPSGNHTFGGYTTVGAETFGLSAANVSGNGVLTSNFVGATTAYAQWMLSNYTGYIWSASTIYAATSMIVGGNTVWHAGNFTPGNYLPLSGGTLSNTLNIGAGGSTNASLLNVTGGVHNQVNITQGSTWGLLLGYCNEGAVSGYHGPNSAAIINVQDGPLHLGAGNTTVLRIVSTGASILGNAILHAGNYSSYAVPLSGGTMSGALQINTPANGVGSAFQLYSTAYHQYMSIYSNGAYEAMINYRNNAAQWYVGLRTTSQLVGTDGFHFYNTSSVQTVGGYTLGGAHYCIGSSFANGNRLVENTGTWGISITGNAGTATTATFVASPDGGRNASTTSLPNTNPRSVRFDFATSASIGGNGNYGGVMTYSPWDGTSASTGDSSYQLAFLNETGLNASGVPGLSIRNGINSAWNGTWYRIITSGNIASQSVSYATTAGSLSSMNVSQFTNNSAYITSASYVAGLNLQGIGSASVNVNNGGSAVYRNENGSGGNLSYAPVLHLGGGDTMWQIQGDYYNSSTLQWRAGYAGSWYAWRYILHTGNLGSYVVPVGGGTFTGNVKITPVSESWAEGLTFMMPTTTTWGGLRWQRQRSGSDGNWYVGFTALDATDDLVFGANNGGTQVNNIIRLTKAGNVSTQGSFTAGGDVTAYSDARVKENIFTIDNALEKTLALRGVYYNRTDKDDKSQKVGVIAQEIQQVLPQVVQEQTDGMLSVSYGNMAGLFIEAIKEQQTQIESQKSEIDVLKDLVQQLINR